MNINKVPPPHTQKRIVYLDLLRITATIAMIMLHVSASNWGNVSVTSFDWKVFNIYDSSVRFCVPVFVMISGAMFLDNSRSLTLHKLFKKNIFRITTAFVFWSTSYAVFYPLMKFFIKSETIVFTQVIYNIIFGHYHLWFLFTLIGLYLATPLLRKITESKQLMEYFLILSVLFCFSINFIAKINDFTATHTATFLSKANLNFFTGYTAYFILGYYLHSIDTPKARRLIIYLAGITSVLFTIIATDTFSVSANSANSTWYSYLLPTTLLTSCAIFLLFKYPLSTLHFNDKTISIINLLSKHSFGIYLIHIFVLLAITEIGLTTTLYNSILSVPVNTIIVFSLSFVAVRLLSKIPFFNKYFL